MDGVVAAHRSFADAKFDRGLLGEDDLVGGSSWWCFEGAWDSNRRIGLYDGTKLSFERERLRGVEV